MPLLDNPLFQAQTRERPSAEGEEEEEEGEDIPIILELVEQINSYIVVMDLDNSASPTAPEDTGTSKVTIALTAPSSSGASPDLPDAAQDPSP